MTSIRYPFWFVTFLVLLALSAIGLAVIADPYRLFGTPPGVLPNQIKPRIDQKAVLAKTVQIERIRPRTLLLGNSRVEIGLDPDSPSWPARAQPIFNAALAGADLLMASRMLEHTVAVEPPALAILGVDIVDFLERPSAPGTPLPTPREQERRLLVDRDGNPNPDRTLQTIKDVVTATLSIDTFTDSLLTLLGQDPATGATMTEKGFNPLREYRIFVARSGHHELFAQKMAIYDRQYARAPRLDFADPEWSYSFRLLRRIMRTAETNGIELIVFIHPYHADYLDMIARVGQWPSFQAWKQTLIHVIKEENKGKARRVQLFDFSGYHEIAREAVPAPGDTQTQMQWYWESGHYKSALGERMIPQLLGASVGFGTDLLTAAHDKPGGQQAKAMP